MVTVLMEIQMVQQIQMEHRMNHGTLLHGFGLQTIVLVEVSGLVHSAQLNLSVDSVLVEDGNFLAVEVPIGDLIQQLVREVGIGNLMIV